jgi:hypothetical protein
MKLGPTSKPLSCYATTVCASISISIAVLSIAIAGPHLHTSGAVLLPSFCLLTFLIMVHVAALTASSGVGLSSAPTVLILDLVQSGVPPTTEREIRRTVARRCQFNGLPASGAVAVGATAWRPLPSYAATTSWRSRRRSGEEFNPTARARLVEAARFAPKQEPR